RETDAESQESARQADLAHDDRRRLAATGKKAAHALRKAELRRSDGKRGGKERQRQEAEDGVERERLHCVPSHGAISSRSLSSAFTASSVAGPPQDQAPRGTNGPMRVPSRARRAG